jgi:hypothetical protein
MVANAKPKEEQVKENIKSKEEEVIKPKVEEVAINKKDDIKPIKKKIIIKKLYIKKHQAVIQKVLMK